VGGGGGGGFWGYAFRDFGSLDGIEYTHEAWRVLLVACYAPLVLWAPLLAVVTWAYWRRRRGEVREGGSSHSSGRGSRNRSSTFRVIRETLLS
jgi:cbb3-type cytochrome oxidase subunit 3